MPTVYAILRSNRVIRGQTTEASLQIAADETLVEWVNPHAVNKDNSFWLMNGDGTTRVATLAEIDTARVDPAVEAAKSQAKVQAVKQAMQNIMGDVLINEKLKVFFRAFNEIL